MMWWLLPLLARADEPPVRADAPAMRVDIDVGCGPVRVTAGDLVVSGGGEVSGTARVRVRRGVAEGCGELHVQMPAAARLSFETVSGSLTVAGLTGRLDFESVTGSLDVVAGDAVPTHIDAESVSGSLRVHVGAQAQVTLESVSGTVSVCGGPVASVDASSMSSDLSVAVSTTARSRIAASTHGGDLTLSLDRRPAALSAQTFSGRVDNGFPSDSVPAATESAEPPGATVAASSFAGVIRLQPLEVECP